MTQSTEHFEEKLKEKREDLKSTVHKLEQRLAPDELFRQLTESFTGEPQEFLQNLGRQVKEQPIPTLMTAAGLTLLMTGQSSQGSTFDTENDPDYDGYQRHERFEGVQRRVKIERDEDDRSYGRRLRDHHAYALNVERHDGEDETSFSQRIEQARLQASESARRFKDKCSRMGDQVSGQTRRAMDKGKSVADQAYSLVQDNPVALGAIGTLIGALVGTALPLSSKETDMLANSADQAVAKLSERAVTAAQSAKAASRDGREWVEEKRAS